MTWPEIWEGNSFKAIGIRVILSPASWLYALGWSCYRLAYDFGLKKSAKPHKNIICVGNLVAGGSGKTPITIYIARLLAEMGDQVVISASGYGGPHSEAAELAPKGELDPKIWGDEPALLRDELPEVPLIVGRRRVLAAEICAQNFPDAVLLMDDGFQHLPLAKDISILVEPDLRNKQCLPAGPYREPQSSLKRADLVLSPKSGFKVLHGPIHPLANNRIAERVTLEGSKPDSLGSSEADPKFDRGRAAPQLGATIPSVDMSQESPMVTEVSVLCAIGNPNGFVAAVREAGYTIKVVRRLDDHDPLDAPDLFAGLTEPIVVTAKDAVKLRGRPEDIRVARRETKIEPEEEFKTWLQARLHRTPK
ncbi:MAG: tetraacyldisaccharide 4'-kinase [Fimbriimonadaceae bacterium]